VFYLKQFFKTLPNVGLAGYFFPVITLVLLSTWTGTKSFNAWWNDHFEVYRERPWFHAIIKGDQDIGVLSGRLREFPEVEEVALIEGEGITSRAKGLLESLGPMPLSLDGTETWKAIKVIFTSKSAMAGQELVREYLLNFVGTENLSAGPIRRPRAVQEEEVISGMVQRWVPVVMMAFVSMLWLFAWMKVSGVMMRRSYLMEKFQRRRFIAFKMMFSGLFLIILPVIAMNVFFMGIENVVQIIAPMGLLLAAFPLLVNWSWRPSE
jgi:hypothetical protein